LRVPLVRAIGAAVFVVILWVDQTLPAKRRHIYKAINAMRVMNSTLSNFIVVFS